MSDPKRPPHPVLGSQAGRDAPQLFNRPAKNEINYRLGTYTSFANAMLAALPQSSVPKRPPNLNGDTHNPFVGFDSSANSNWAVALIDAWAEVGDVLCFYQERIANEGYLSTAIEPLSIDLMLASTGASKKSNAPTAADTAADSGSKSGANSSGSTGQNGGMNGGTGNPNGQSFPITGPGFLAHQTRSNTQPNGGASNDAHTAHAPLPTKLVPGSTQGYPISPGLAAETYLAFTVSDNKNATGYAVVPQGLQIMNHPLNGAQPQTFELGVTATLRATWNAMPATVTQTPVSPAITGATTGILLQGTSTGLAPGVSLLALGQSQNQGQSFCFGEITSVTTNKTTKQTLAQWSSPLTNQTAATNLTDLSLFSLPQSSALFGYNAPEFTSQPSSVKLGYPDSLKNGANQISLPSSGPWTPTSLNAGLPDLNINAVMVSADGTNFFATDKGVYYRTKSAITWTAMSNGLLPKSIVSLAQDATGILYCGGNGGAVYRATKAGEAWETLSGSAAQVIQPWNADPKSTASIPPPSYKLQKTSLPNSLVHQIYPLDLDTQTSADYTTTATAVLTGYGLFVNLLDGNGWTSINNPSFVATGTTTLTNGYSTLPISDAVVFADPKLAYIAFDSTLWGYPWVPGIPMVNYYLQNLWQSLDTSLNTAISAMTAAQTDLTALNTDVTTKLVPDLHSLGTAIKALTGTIDHIVNTLMDAIKGIEVAIETIPVVGEILKPILDTLNKLLEKTLKEVESNVPTQFALVTKDATKIAQDVVTAQTDFNTAITAIQTQKSAIDKMFKSHNTPQATAAPAPPSYCPPLGTAFTLPNQTPKLKITQVVASNPNGTQSDSDRIFLVGATNGVYIYQNNALTPLTQTTNSANSVAKPVRSLTLVPNATTGDVQAVAGFDDGIYSLILSASGSTKTGIWTKEIDFVAPAANAPQSQPAIPVATAIAQTSTTLPSSYSLFYTAPLIYPDQWPDFHINGSTLNIASATAQVADRSYLVTQGPQTSQPQTQQTGAFNVISSAKTTATAYTLSSKVVDVGLGAPIGTKVDLSSYNLREVKAFYASAPLTPVVKMSTNANDPISSDIIDVTGVYPDLPIGGRLAIGGRNPRAKVISMGGIFSILKSSQVQSNTPVQQSDLANFDVRSCTIYAPNKHNAPKEISVAAGPAGVLQSIDNGISWHPFTTGLTLPKTHAPLTTDIIKSAQDGTLYAVTNAGLYSASPTPWTSQKSLQTQAEHTDQAALDLTNITALAGDSGGRVFGATLEGDLYRSSQTHPSFAPLSQAAPPQQNGQDSIASTPAINVTCLAWWNRALIAGTRASGIQIASFPSTDQYSWAPLDHDPTNRLMDITDLAVSRDGTIFAATKQGMMRWAKRAWISIPLPVPAPIAALAIDAKDVLFIATSEGLFSSQNMGANWQKLPNPISKTGTQLDQVALVGGQNGVICLIQTGQLFHWQTGAFQWRALVSLPKDTGNAGSPLDVTHGANGDTWALFASDIWSQAERKWQRTEQPTPDADITALDLVNSTLFATTIAPANGAIQLHQSDDKAASWPKVSTAPLGTSSVTSLCWLSNSTLLAGTQGTGVFEIDTTTLSWTSKSEGLSNLNVSDIGLSQSETIVATTLGGGVFQFDATNSLWQGTSAQITNLTLNCLSVTDDASWVVGSQGSGLFTSTNRGATWQEIDLGTSNDISTVDYQSDTGLIWTGARAKSYINNAQSHTDFPLRMKSCFSVPASFASDLNQGFLPATLLKYFSDANLSLSGAAIVQTIRLDKTWIINDNNDSVYALSLNGFGIQISQSLDSVIVNAQSGSPTLTHLAQWDVTTDTGFMGTLGVNRDQTIILPSKSSDPTLNEISQLNSISVDAATKITTLTLDAAVKNLYDRSSVVINANVVHATQGRTIPNEIPSYQGVGAHGEVLGNGNAQLTNQSFKLRQSPLTFTAAPAPIFRQSSLTIFVNDEIWNEVASLSDYGGNAKIYTVSITSTGTTVSFGDGINGQRLPSGTRNVVANYRVGLGPAGDVAAGNITIVQQHVNGISRVTNPVAARDGQPPEPALLARQNSQKHLSNSGGVVTLANFSAFADAYPGVAKSTASYLKCANQNVVALTLKQSDITQKSQDGFDLSVFEEAINTAQAAPAKPLRVLNGFLRRFELDITIWAQNGVKSKDLCDLVKAALAARFNSAVMGFGETVTPTKVSDVLQYLPGVAGISVNDLYFSGDKQAFNSSLAPNPALYNTSSKQLSPAEILIIGSDPGVTIILPPKRGSDATTV